MIRKRSRKSVRGAAALLLALGLGACGDPVHPQAAGRPLIVATIWPLADLTRQLAADEAEVICLLPSGASIHGAELTAQQAEALQQADLVVGVGMGLDDWALALAPGRTAPVVLLSGSMRPHRHGHGSDGAHAQTNPHLWLDPVRVEAWLGQLADGVRGTLGEQAADRVNQRERRLKKELQNLHQAFSVALAPHRGRRIVTFHNAFTPLAQRYGLEVTAVLGAHGLAGSITPNRMEAAMAAIRQEGMGTVFVEPGFSPGLTAALGGAREIRVLLLDPIGNRWDPRRSSYSDLMRYNLNVLLEGLTPARGE